jgi:hypothetical protein
MDGPPSLAQKLSPGSAVHTWLSSRQLAMPCFGSSPDVASWRQSRGSTPSDASTAPRGGQFPLPFVGVVMAFSSCEDWIRGWALSADALPLDVTYLVRSRMLAVTTPWLTEC